MSYILDALKKAESERKLGSIPDMHAQPLTARSTGGPQAWRSPVGWAVLTTVLLIAAAIIWRVQSQSDRDSNANAPLPHQASSGAVSPDGSGEAGQVPPVAPDPALPSIAKASASESPDIPPKMAVPVEPSKPSKASKPKTVPKPVQKKKAAQASTSKPASAAAGAAVRPLETEKPKPSAAVLTPEPRLPRLYELPGSIQREIPPLTVSGYIYSRIPAERSVLINNRLLREGGEISPGLVLEKMLPKEAVLNYNGYRYRIPY